MMVSGLESPAVEGGASKTQMQNVESNVENTGNPITSVADPVEAQEHAIAAIEEMGGSVAMDEKSPDNPVIEVSFFNSNVTDRGLKHLKGLTSLKGLYLDKANVSDRGLVHLKGLTNLQRLWLSETNVTDRGLEHLKGLASLEWLFLNDTKVTDFGLEHLNQLANLKLLKLFMNEVKDEGVKKLQAALPNCEIYH